MNLSIVPLKSKSKNTSGLFCTLETLQLPNATMSLILGLVAISASSRGKVFAIILLIVLFSGLFFMLRFITKKEQDYA